MNEKCINRKWTCTDSSNTSDSCNYVVVLTARRLDASSNGIGCELCSIT